MERLTKAEEPIMKIIWKKNEVFVKDIIEELEEKSPYNTVSSIVRILESKGMVSHKAYGRIHQYFPVVSKNEYRRNMLKNIIVEYFDGSYKGLLSQVLADEDVSDEEIEELKDLIKKS
ncbi:BlaI/MecI/CopY family transcriptional regulator [Ekhidna sp.]|uniref:BlaI/MecI/CopY family transcriptional regulator n=1 Tax=Ekhidna sp. TaxID=2608089 RepID=UPI003B5CFD47